MTLLTFLCLLCYFRGGCFVQRLSMLFYSRRWTLSSLSPSCWSISITSLCASFHHKCVAFLKSGSSLNGIFPTALSVNTPIRCFRLLACLLAQMCFERCSEDAANTHFGTQWSIECFCANDPELESINKFIDTPAMCDYACEGDGFQTCGGYEAMSVYTIAPQ